MTGRSNTRSSDGVVSSTTGEQGPSFSAKASMLETTSVSRVFRRGNRTIVAVDSVSLSINPSETLAVVGETGCGKSTLAKMVTGLERPSSGNVYFEGTDIYSASRSQRRGALAGMHMVFQDALGSLDPRWTARRSIAEPLRAHHAGGRAEIEGRVAELLETVGLDPSIGARRPVEMSGGQRQRVGIARALALRPKLIVADEPVSALDVSVQAQVVNLLKEVQEHFGLSYLIIAHGLEVVRHISHRVAVMYLGRLVELGEARPVFSAPSHPYTEALLAAAPRPDPAARQELRALPGEMPSAGDPPSGCHFHPRCPARQSRCEHERPELREVAPGRMTACHFPLLETATVPEAASGQASETDRVD